MRLIPKAFGKREEENNSSNCTEVSKGKEEGEREHSGSVYYNNTVQQELCSTCA